MVSCDYHKKMRQETISTEKDCIMCMCDRCCKPLAYCKCNKETRW